jgi:hypothetical protein
MLGLLPVVYLLVRGFLASRNVAYWDELDSALGLLVHLKSGAGWREVLNDLFAVTNEHRTVTSRILFVVSYGWTGTVNFTVVGVIGNLFICALAGLLVVNAGDDPRKIRMMVLLAALLFQLEHFENFFWSGSSIDHFQVVLLAGLAVVGLARGSRPALLGAILCALLATFTLAQGLMVWPAGAITLAVQRRWRQLGAWLGLGGFIVAIYFCGFAFNPGHHVADLSLVSIGRILHFWLVLLGIPLAFGYEPIAPFLGLGLLALLARLLLQREIFSRERVALPMALWAVMALLLLAIGRVNVALGHVYSRYYVLGALAWALVLFMKFETWGDAARPYRLLLRVVPALILFNVVADCLFEASGETWIACRNAAADAYVRSGKDGTNSLTLYPDPAYGTRVIQQAEEAGVFRMPELCRERPWSDAPLSSRMVITIDRIASEGKILVVEGWVAVKDATLPLKDVSIVLETTNGRRIFNAIAASRPDVVAHFAQQGSWQSTGFRFECRRWLLPKGDYRIGALTQAAGQAEYAMTDRRLELGADELEVGRDVVHANGSIYDHTILGEASAVFTAAKGKPHRISFLDQTDTLVHVDFSGAGTLKLSLQAASGPIRARHYREPKTRYLRGHAALAVEGADETTHISITSARRTVVPAGGASASFTYDGSAHIASLSIASRNGRFGGVRMGNVKFSAATGFAGIRAPGVQFTGPVFVGEITARNEATAMLILGTAPDVRITGGSLRQTNGRAVKVAGVTQLKFVDGSTAEGTILRAQTIQARLEQDGTDVTPQLAQTTAARVTTE